MTENDFTKDVIDHAHRFGWLCVHFRPAMIGPKSRMMTAYQGDGKGFPDIVAVRERVVFAELKIPPNQITTEQKVWAKTLVAAGVEIYLWTPDDEEDIVKTFAGTRPPRPAAVPDPV